VLLELAAINDQDPYAGRPTAYSANEIMIPARLHARRAKGCCRHDWMLGGRKDVVGMTGCSAHERMLSA